MLGLRFRDASTERPVTDGLHVRVRRMDGLGRGTAAVRSTSGAYVAQGLTGLRRYERERGDAPRPVPDVEKADFLVDIRDQNGRFVPVLLSVTLPYAPDSALGGLYPVADPSPDEEPEENGGREPVCYLFSSVHRPVPPGQVAVYADLVAGTGASQRPAAHAVMEVRHDPSDGGPPGPPNGGVSAEEVWYGIADGEGRVAVQFPTPTIQLEELSENGNGGPGGGPPENGADDSEVEGSRSTLSTRTWELEIRVYYQPSSLDIPSRAQRPPLKPIVEQEAGTIYDEPGSDQGSVTDTLRAGQSLVLRTDGQSELRIAPASDGS